MRILIVADSVGGVWQFSLELARGLLQRGDQVALATMGALLRDDQQREVEAIPGLQLYASDYRLLWMDDAWADIERAGDWLLTVADEFRPDVVHLNDLGHGSINWPAPLLLTAHSCVSSWWRAVQGCDAPSQWQRYRDTVSASLGAAQHVVAPTQAMLDAVMHCHIQPAELDHFPASVIYNGCDAQPAGDAVSNLPMVLGAGRLWDEAKNLAALARVAPRLEWPVFLAGDSNDSGGSSAQFSGAHLLGQLPQQQISQWYARAAIYALPARYEPFGLSVLEAARAGCALVLGDIPSLREVWGDAAVYVRPDDDDALCAALQKLIADDAARLELGQRAAFRSRRYPAAAMVRAYRQRYAALVEHAGETPVPTWRDEGPPAVQLAEAVR